MGLLGQMTVRLGVNVNQFNSGMNSAAGTLQQFASGAGKLGPVVAIVAAVGVAAVGLGVASVKAAADFQQSMLKVQAYAGLSKKQTDDLGNSILSMAAAMGQSPKAMADALYPIISSGYSASQALTILKLSAETSAASGAKMSVVADALTTSLKAMHAPASQASGYMDMFNKIVALGKGEVPQYAATIGKLALAASSAHQPFSVMGAALATLTTHGFPSVAQASTSLGNLFTQLDVKTDAVAAHAKKLGLSFDESKFKTLSFQQQLSYLQQITGGNTGELLKLVGGSTVALKAFTALTSSSKDFTSNLNAMKNATGTTANAYQVASGGLNAANKRVSASMEVLKIKIGQGLLPVQTAAANTTAKVIQAFISWEDKTHGVEAAISTVQGVIGGITGTISGLVTNLSNLVGYFQKNHDAATLLLIPLGLLGGAFTYMAYTGVVAFLAALPGLIAGFIAGATAAWTMAAGVLAATWPFLLIGLAIGAAVAIIVLAVQHWGQITAWFKGIWGAFTSWFMGIWSAFVAWFQATLAAWKAFFIAGWTAIVNFLKAAGAWIVAAVLSPFTAIGNLFIWLYGHNVYIQQLVDKIRAYFSAGIAFITAIWNNVINWLVAKWNYWRALATVVFALITAIVQSQVTRAQSILMSVWNTAIGWLANKWASMRGFAASAWAAVSSVFSSAWNTYIAGPLSRIWSSITGWWNNTVVGGASSLGSSLIQAIAGGISSGAGAVWSAVHGAISNALSGLGFHGIPGFAGGVKNFAGGYAIVGENGPELVKLPGGSDVYPNGSGPSLSGSGSSSNGGEQHIYVMLDSDMLAHAIGNKQAKIIRVKHGRRAA